MLPVINKDCFLFDIDVETKGELIEKMVETFDNSGYLNDKNLFHKDVLAREDVFSTFIDFVDVGVGLPHGKSKGVDEAGICVSRLNNDVVWDEKTGNKASLVIMIAVGDMGENSPHLQILSKLSRMLMHEEFRSKIKSGTVDEVYNVLKEELEG